MTGRLEGRVVVVTGAGSGIGRATARRVASDGATVVVSDINDDAAQATAADITRAGGEASVRHLDVADRDSWAEVIAGAVADHGAVHGLVNNAGITKDRSLLKMTDEDWRIAIDVNLRGTWLGCQSVLPAMREAGAGSIVNLSSESRHGAFGQANYAAAKAGVVGLTKTVALEGARHGIRCNAVAPGTIDTPMVQAVSQDIRESWLTTIPLGRVGEPDEVARAISFLLSDDSSYVTGHVLDVDGGSSR